jgi:hypothetical protein
MQIKIVLGRFSVYLQLLLVDQTFVAMCTRVTSSYLWVETSLMDMLQSSATSSSFLIFPLVSFSPPSSSYIFLRTRPKILKTRLTNQKVRIVMAFETG